MNKLLLIVFLFLACISSHAQDEFTLAKKGDRVPEFSFEVKPGEIRRITDYQGKVVLITFFATWCGPCRAELPHIDKEIFQKNRQNDDFALLIFGREHDRATVEKFRKKQKYSMPLYPDPERKIFSLFAGQNIPRNFLLDRNGIIIWSSVGYNKEGFNSLKREIEKRLKNIPGIN